MNLQTLNESKKINLKKLSRMVSKYNNEFDTINIKKLIDEMMNWSKEDHVLFQLYFIQNKTQVELSSTFGISIYLIRKSIRRSLKTISTNTEILKQVTC